MCCIFEELTQKKWAAVKKRRRLSLQITRTRIFARHSRPGYQSVVYSMVIASENRAAMILPIPVVPGSGEDALIFHDLSAYPQFFDDLDQACFSERVEDPFLAPVSEAGFDHMGDMGGYAEGAVKLLTVHEVGDYEASYVPGLSDFDRLDPRFRMPDEIWRQLPIEDDYGFAVFQLKFGLSDAQRQVENDIHPMAFEFPTRDESRLFYPTVHVHDRMYHSEAGFHHELFCQREHARAEFKHQRDLLEGKNPSPAQVIRYSPEHRDAADRFEGYHWFFESRPDPVLDVDIDRCHGLVDGTRPIARMNLQGDYPNHDIWLGDFIATPRDMRQDGNLTDEQVQLIRQIPRAHISEARYLQTHGFQLVEIKPWSKDRHCYVTRQFADFGYSIYQLRETMGWDFLVLAEGDDRRAHSTIPKETLANLSEEQLDFINAEPTDQFGELDEELQLSGFEITGVKSGTIILRRVIDYELDLDAYLESKAKQHKQGFILDGEMWTRFGHKSDKKGYEAFLMLTNDFADE